MNYKGRFNRHLHPATQVLFLDTDELSIIGLLLGVAQMIGGDAWYVALFGPLFIIPYKREQSRGFFNHTLYHMGFFPLYGYPNTEAKVFHE